MGNAVLYEVVKCIMNIQAEVRPQRTACGCSEAKAGREMRGGVARGKGWAVGKGEREEGAENWVCCVICGLKAGKHATI